MVGAWQLSPQSWSSSQKLQPDSKAESKTLGLECPLPETHFLPQGHTYDSMGRGSYSNQHPLSSALTLKSLFDFQIVESITFERLKMRDTLEKEKRRIQDLENRLTKQTEVWRSEMRGPSMVLADPSGPAVRQTDSNPSSAVRL